MSMKIGFVVAISREMIAVFERFGAPMSEKKVGGGKLYVYQADGMEFDVLHSGIGLISAAAAAVYLVSVENVDVLVNYGVVGGLTEEAALNRTYVVTKVVHYNFDVSPIDPVAAGQYPEFPDVYIPVYGGLAKKALSLYPEFHPAISASADRFVADAEEKAALHEKYGADICDMESAAIALIAYRHEKPLLMVKTVSDGIADGAEGFERECKSASAKCLDAAIRLLGGVS